MQYTLKKLQTKKVQEQRIKRVQIKPAQSLQKSICSCLLIILKIMIIEYMKISENFPKNSTEVKGLQSSKPQNVDSNVQANIQGLTISQEQHRPMMKVVVREKRRVGVSFLYQFVNSNIGSSINELTNIYINKSILCQALQDFIEMNHQVFIKMTCLTTISKHLLISSCDDSYPQPYKLLNNCTLRIPLSERIRITEQNAYSEINISSLVFHFNKKHLISLNFYENRKSSKLHYLSLEFEEVFKKRKNYIKLHISKIQLKIKESQCIRTNYFLNLTYAKIKTQILPLNNNPASLIFSTTSKVQVNGLDDYIKIDLHQKSIMAEKIGFLKLKINHLLPQKVQKSFPIFSFRSPSTQIGRIKLICIDRYHHKVKDKMFLSEPF